ncbi:MAG: CDP-archaeol synthase, partial [Gemmatimonas sp.]
KSYCKRRIGIAPGGRWIPADQLDFVIGAVALIAPLARFTLLDVATILAISFVGDLAVNQIAFRLGIRETMW